MAYAVIFTSHKRGDDGYGETSDRMLELARQQPGFIAFESARGADGLGITVSYWNDLESIRAWKANAEHRVAQARGKSEWYADYKVRVAKIEYEYGFDVTR
jgi:heme-degrading monooxygenase HmoA